MLLGLALGAAILTSAALTACSGLALLPRGPASTSVAAPHTVVPIAGAIRWSEPAAAPPRAVQTSLAEVANGATVSLIDPSGGQTVATTVTTAEGRFSLDLAGWAPVRDAPYVLEAIKGLGLGGKANRAGAPVARLRTIVQLSGASWTSFTGPAVVVSRSTTALAALTGLNRLSTSQIRDLVGTIQTGSPDVYSPTTAVSAADYQAVWGLVDAALALNQDAIRAIARSLKDGSYVRIERAPVVTDVSALSGSPGDVIAIHGNGFDPTAASNFVRFGGVLASEIRVDAAGTRLEATVPAGARSGDLAIQVGNLATRVPGDFQFQPAYTELAVEPNILDPGGTAAVTGPGLPTASDFAVTLNDVPVATWSLQVPGSRFTFTLPEGASTGYLRFRAPFSAEVIGPLVKVRGTVGTLAGTGSPGYRDGMGPEALFGLLGSIALDAAGNLYVGDLSNHRIRKISKFGQVSTFAGNGQRGARDGLGTEAQFYEPWAFSDSMGQLYTRDVDGRGHAWFTGPAIVISPPLSRGVEVTHRHVLVSTRRSCLFQTTVLEAHFVIPCRARPGGRRAGAAASIPRDAARPLAVDHGVFSDERRVLPESGGDDQGIERVVGESEPMGRQDVLRPQVQRVHGSGVKPCRHQFVQGA